MFLAAPLDLVKRPTPKAFGAAPPLSYPGARATKIRSIGNTVNATTVLDLLFRFGDIRREIFFASAKRRHEANTLILSHHPGPTVLIDVTPPVEMFGRARLRVAFRWKHEELHLLFYDPNLRDTLAFFIVEHANPQRFQIRELRRHVVMRETMFHKKEVSKCFASRLHWIEHHRFVRTGGNQQPLRRRLS